jgi:hypothetical protein
MNIFTWTKRLILTVSFLALIAINLLTLTHTAFNAAVSGLMGTAFGIQTVSDVLRSKVDARNKTIKNRKVATRKFGTKVTKRTKKLVATTLAEIPGEAIPLLGIPILIAATAYEITLACENLDDLEQLYSDMGMVDETPNDVMHSVCNPTLPEAGKVWGGVVEKSGEWLDGVIAAPWS